MAVVLTLHARGLEDFKWSALRECSTSPTATLFTLALFYNTLPGDQTLLNALRIHDEGWREFLAWFDINPIASLSMTALLLLSVPSPSTGTRRPHRPPHTTSPRPRHRPPQGLVIVLPKLFVGRPRPEGALFDATDSFPSGTAATAVLVLGLAIYFAGLHITHARLRIPLQATLTAAIIALSIFRLLAGEHYPSDVLAGWLAGALSLLAIIALHRRLRFRTSDNSPP